MQTLHIDVETYSDIDLKMAGVYRYAYDPSFRVLLFGYAADDDPVEVIDLESGEAIPAEVIAALTDPAVIKKAFNANFERVCLARHTGQYMEPGQWRCVQAKSLYNGLPASLDHAARALNLDVQKDRRGVILMNSFSKPPRKLPHEAPEKWNTYKFYCQRDVEVERELDRQLIALPPKERLIWEIDQRINDAGVMVDPALVEAAIQLDATSTRLAIDKLKDLTGLDNPNSLSQLKGWLEGEGVDLPEGLRKEALPALIEAAENPIIKEVLSLRGQINKSSVKKYTKMEAMTTQAGRIHGLHQYYGASRTGRWAGRGVQVQNLTRNSLPDLDGVRGQVMDDDPEWVSLLHGDGVPDVLSQLVRTAFVAPRGRKFIVSDFASIEARVIAWLAGEEWALKVFRGDGKIYETTAAQMFKVPLDTITRGHKNYDLRQKGKVAVLACGYGGGPGALKAMGALSMGLAEEELPEIITRWRQANAKIVRFWHSLEAAVLAAVHTGRQGTLRPGLKFTTMGKKYPRLWIDLPSGRALCYPHPLLMNRKIKLKDGTIRIKQGLNYMGGAAATGTVLWRPEWTYGGKLAENVTQAIARDCLAESMIRLHKAGHKIVMHIHDEVVLEVDKRVTVQEIEEIMSLPIPWAPELPMSAAGFESDYYKKD